MNKYVAALIAVLLVASVLLGELYTISSYAYVSLLRNHNSLIDKWNNLVMACNATNIAFGWMGEPLGHKKTPSMNELELWLRNDTTDEYEYDDPDFDCFHYSVTLMLHGRAKHYDIGVIVMYGYKGFSGQRWFHCINAINTSEGLAYIEPQLDEVWYLEDHSEMTNGRIYFFPGSGYVYVEEIKILFDY